MHHLKPPPGREPPPFATCAWCGCSIPDDKSGFYDARRLMVYCSIRCHTAARKASEEGKS